MRPLDKLQGSRKPQKVPPVNRKEQAPSLPRAPPNRGSWQTGHVMAGLGPSIAEVRVDEEGLEMRNKSCTTMSTSKTKEAKKTQKFLAWKTE